MKRKPFMIVIVFLVLGFAIGIIGKVVSFRFFPGKVARRANTTIKGNISASGGICF